MKLKINKCLASLINADIVKPKLSCFVSRQRGGIETQPGEVPDIIDVVAVYRGHPNAGIRIGRFGLN